MVRYLEANETAERCRGEALATAFSPCSAANSMPPKRLMQRASQAQKRRTGSASDSPNSSSCAESKAERPNSPTLPRTLLRTCLASPVLVPLSLWLLPKRTGWTQLSNRSTRIAADEFAALPRDMTWPVSLFMVCELVARLGDTDRASAISELFGGWTGTLIVVGANACCIGAADRGLGRASSLPWMLNEAERHYQRALSLEEQVDLPPLMARTQYWYARMLFDRGGLADDGQAHELVAVCLDTAVAIGMDSLAAETRALLDRHT